MGDLIQFVPKPNPNREKHLEQMAAEIFNVALAGWTEPEYVAPLKDPA